jgi:hypothetical protein
MPLTETKPIEVGAEGPVVGVSGVELPVFDEQPGNRPFDFRLLHGACDPLGALCVEGATEPLELGGDCDEIGVVQLPREVAASAPRPYGYPACVMQSFRTCVRCGCFPHSATHLSAVAV